LTSEYNVSLIDLNLEEDREEIKLYDLDEREVHAMVSKRVIQSDCRISVAIPKTHDTAIVTLTLKNMMGSLARSDRGKMHGYAGDTERDFLKSVRVMPKNLVALGKHVAPHASAILEHCPENEWKYGYGFWSNDHGKLWPQLPRDSYAASGAGQKHIWVCPSLDLVVAQSPGIWENQEENGDGLLRRVMEACE